MKSPFYWRSLCALLLTLSLATCNSPNQDVQDSSSSTLELTIDQYLERHIESGKFNGTLLIGKGDSVVYLNAYGMANRAFGISNTPDTKFLIGSITKPFTALAIMVLYERGALDLEDKLSLYFPDFPAAEKISIRQLLNHTAGLDDYRKLSDWKADSKSDLTSPQSTIAKMSKVPLLYEPGERFRYSNVGYILLGLIIEQVSQQSFADFIQDEILNPLQLNNTGIADYQRVIPNLASGYSSSPKEIRQAEYVNYDQPFSSGNMYATPYDLWAFTKAVVDSKLISAANTQKIFEDGEHYGYGWGLRTFGKVKAYGHYGGMNGFVGAITYIPEGEWFICLLTNDENTPKVRLTNDLVSIIMGEEVPLPARTKLIQLPNKTQRQLIGDYLVEPGDTLKVFEENDRLYLQENRQMKHELFPYEHYKCSFKYLEFNAVFEGIEKGSPQTLSFVGRDTILTAKRISKVDKP